MLQNKLISVTKRTRMTPYTRRVEAAGVKAYTVYNHMLLPTVFESPQADYWHLCEHVQVWDVAAEVQVEVRGPDAARLVQLMTPRDLRKIEPLQGKYAPMCDAQGFILNDPIVIKHNDQRWWISLADSDIKLWAKGLAQGYGFDVEVFEPTVYPLAVQGPKAEELVSRVFGDEARDIRFFRGEMLEFGGESIYVARSGWSKQGGFEIYLHAPELAEPLWDALFEHGEDLHVRAGCPNGIERIEAGLLSYGSDMDASHTPLDCGLGSYLNLQADIESLSIAALREKAKSQSIALKGLIFKQVMDFSSAANSVGGFDVWHDDVLIGEIKSQVWSPRYNKHLCFAMLDTKYLNENSTLEMCGQQGTIHDIPFPEDALSA